MQCLYGVELTKAGGTGCDEDTSVLAKFSNADFCLLRDRGLGVNDANVHPLLLFALDVFLFCDTTLGQEALVLPCWPPGVISDPDTLRILRSAFIVRQMLEADILDHTC